MKKGLLANLLIVVLTLAVWFGPSQVLTATLYYGTPRTIDHFREGQIYYLSLNDLAEALNHEIQYDPISCEAVLISGGEQLGFSNFSCYARLGNSVRNITYPVIYQKGDLYIPALTAVPLVAEITNLAMAWDNTELSIRAVQRQYNILDVRFSPRSNGYLCEIFLANPLPYEVIQTEGDWLNLTLQGGKLDENYIANRPHSRVIRDIRAFQFDGSAQISINFRRDITELHHALATNPDRIQIAIIDTGFDYSAMDTIFSEPGEHYNPIDVIVIDAGHGGVEDGAIGPRGALEKHIVLDIARRLAALLEKDTGLQVIMTRDSDTTLLLDERAQIANSSGGELYVSIHANWFEDASIKGSQTFFLAAALNDAARATAMLENKSLLINNSGEITDTLNELELILFDLLQTEYLSESQALATEIQSQLINSLNTRNRGVDQAGFFVLNKVYMPSVLVEVAFISNKHEEALLGKESFRQKAAEGIYRGIRNFIDKNSHSN